MIDIVQVHKQFSGNAILEGVSLRVGQNEKIGLIGRNGAGKSTLLRMITGQDRDYSGRIVLSGDVRIGYVPQSFPPFEGTVLDFLIQSFHEQRTRLAELEESMGIAGGRELERIMAEYATVREQYDNGAGDEAEERGRRYVASLGMGSRLDVSVSVLSGGERNVLSLARALLEHPDVLILDEPGNHLDVWGLAWLEGFISQYPGTVLLVSHNRYLLDRTVTRLIEIERGGVREFSGNYSAYRLDRLRCAVSGEMAYRADRKKIEQLEETVRRFEQIARANPDPAWGRRLRSRRTHLEKTRQNAAQKPDNPDSSFDIAFASGESRATIALRVDGFTCGFDGRELLRDVSLFIETGQRVALVGPNGCGKTTFLNAVMKDGSPDGRIIRIGPSMKVAYCSQHGEGLDPGATILSACLDAGALNLDESWKVMSRFLFEREDLSRAMGTLSGGERNRLQLALAVIARANFLILDEPTNHLDIQSCEAVEDALSEFSGTILVVSHDRYFMDRIATRVIEIEESGFVEWNGNFSEFWYRRYGASLGSPAGRLRTGSSGSGDINRRGEQISQAKAEKKSASAIDIERRIVSMEAERERLEKKLHAAYTDGQLRQARDIGTRLDELSRIIERLYEEWV